MNSSRWSSAQWRLDEQEPVDEQVMTHKCRGSIIVLPISKSVKPNEEQKEMISGFQ